MLRNFFLVLFLLVANFCGTAFASDQPKISPYLRVGTVTGSVSDTTNKVKSALQAGQFEILGDYHPAQSEKMAVVVYSRKDLQTVALQIKDRGALAAPLKVGILEGKPGQVVVSMLNPEYLFAAYLRKEVPKHEKELSKVTADAKAALKAIGSDFQGFGGEKTADDLEGYFYMWPAATQTFDDPVKLAKFKSFEEGVQIIQKNLAEKRGGTAQVYSFIVPTEKVAIFGVALNDKEKGEPNFLPKIGSENLAALPYEIALYDTKATMLHGKFRLAVSWPELGMGTFMSISGTPGDIEDTLKLLVTEKTESENK